MREEYNVLTVLAVKEHHKEILEKSAPNAHFTYCSVKDVTKEMIQDADVILGNVPADMIKGTTRLKWLQLASAGTDGYTADGVLPKGAILTNATGAYGLAISEHMLGALLTVMKKFHLYAEDQKNHVWSDHGHVISIMDSKTLVVGCGDIGSEFAKRMHALGSSVIGIRRTKADKPEYLEALYQMDKLYDCLKDADIVATSLPGTKETYKVFNKEAFAAMKQGAYFINVGRGNAVDSDALADALNSGHLAGASIDVTDPEPLPKDHPLWDAKNLLITPHVSGFDHLPETFEKIIRITARNLDNFENGRVLENEVDFSTGYRRI